MNEPAGKVVAGGFSVDPGTVKLIHSGRVKLIHPFVQWSPEA